MLTQLEENNITYSGETIVAQYNDPWTPRFMRTNEIRVEVDYVQKSQ
ncbi:hypothetical protein GW750_01525 [bacterium]|nr:hypothetical protein [bacterium]